MAESSKTGSTEIIKVMRQALRNQLVEISNIRMVYARIIGEIQGIDEYSQTLQNNIINMLAKDLDFLLEIERKKERDILASENNKKQLYFKHITKKRVNRYFILRRQREEFFLNGNAEGV